MIDLAAASHAGEISGEVIATISGVAGGLAKVVSSVITPKPAAVLGTAAGVSSLTMAIWVYSNGAWSREGAWGIFAAYGVILAATYGVLKALDHPMAANAMGAVTSRLSKEG